MDPNAANTPPAPSTDLDELLAVLRALPHTNLRAAVACAYAVGVRDGRDGMSTERVRERVADLLQ